MDPFGRLPLVVAALLLLLVLPQAEEVEARRYHKYRPLPPPTPPSPRSPAVMWCDCELCNQTFAPEDVSIAAEAEPWAPTTAAVPAPEVDAATRPRINRPPKTPKPPSPTSPAVLWCDCAVCNNRTFGAESLPAAESWAPTTAAAVPSQLGGFNSSAGQQPDLWVKEPTSVPVPAPPSPPAPGA